MVAGLAHNQKVGGSIPSPVTNFTDGLVEATTSINVPEMGYAGKPSVSISSAYRFLNKDIWVGSKP